MSPQPGRKTRMVPAAFSCQKVRHWISASDVDIYESMFCWQTLSDKSRIPSIPLRLASILSPGWCRSSPSEPATETECGRREHRLRRGQHPNGSAWPKDTTYMLCVQPLSRSSSGTQQSIAILPLPARSKSMPSLMRQLMHER